MEATEIELNEKLARWAGFKKNPSGHRRPDGKYGAHWHYPDGLDYAEAPDFTRSLDACVRWIWPKILGDEIRIALCWDGSTDVEIETGVSGIAKKNEHPALALCRATEQMIDSEVTAGGK